MRRRRRAKGKLKPMPVPDVCALVAKNCANHSGLELATHDGLGGRGDKNQPDGLLGGRDLVGLARDGHAVRVLVNVEARTG